MQTVISLETAEKLHELGLRHPIGVGDSYMEDNRGPYLYPWQAPTSYVKNTYLWLLRLDQVMDEIERLRPGEEISFTAAFAGGRLCHVGRHCTGFGPNNTEAAGRVLVEIMEMP